METFYLNASGIPETKKVAGDGKDYTFDWTDWCANEDTDIASYALDIPAGLTNVQELREGKLVTFVVDDGVPGYAYPVRCHVVATRTPLLEATRTMYIRVVAEQ